MSYTHYTLLSLTPSSADGFNNGSAYSDVFFNINKYFTDFNVNEICTIKLISAVFPSSCYIIRTGINDTFKLTYSNISHTITIPAGNYNVYTFSSAIKGLLTDIANFSLEYSAVTGKYVMICNEVNDLFSIIPGVTYRLFGSDESTTYTSVLGRIQFPFMADFSGISKFRLECQQVPSDNYATVSAINFLAEIPNKTNAYGITYWDTNDDYEVFIPISQQLTFLNIVVKDQYNRFIDFNKIDWNIVLQIKFTNRSVNINRFQQEFSNNEDADPEEVQNQIDDTLNFATTDFTDPYSYIESGTENQINTVINDDNNIDFTAGQPEFMDLEEANNPIEDTDPTDMDAVDGSDNVDTSS